MNRGNTDTGIPALWGVVDNRNFKPKHGKAVHIDSLRI
jgi:hypothetical protein